MDPMDHEAYGGHDDAYEKKRAEGDAQLNFMMRYDAGQGNSEQKSQGRSVERFSKRMRPATSNDERSQN